MSLTVEQLLAKLDFQPTALATRFPHVLTKIAELWGHPRLDDYFNELIFDTRGNRQGFPDDAAGEIMRLSLKHSSLMGGGQEPGGVWGSQHISR